MRSTKAFVTIYEEKMRECMFEIDALTFLWQL